VLKRLTTISTKTTNTCTTYSNLGNVTALTATSATAASNRYSDELTFTLTQKLTKFCNRKPSKYKNLVKICYPSGQKVKKYGFSDRTQGG